jgi:threonine/homoserine/homoserine lactone efflux protein
MLGVHDLPLFILSGLLLNITPGQDFAYIVSRSAGMGWRAGAMAALGVGAGCVVHILAAAFGISALLAASATAFTAVKLGGAAYLLWIGLGMLRSARHSPAQAAHLAGGGMTPRTPLAVVFRQGFLTNALNPKVALFFLAFLPQFVDKGAAHPMLALLLLGAIFAWNGTLWNLFVAWSAARLAAAMHKKTRLADRAGAWCKAATGALFIGLGLRLAFSDVK